MLHTEVVATATRIHTLLPATVTYRHFPALSCRFSISQWVCTKVAYFQLLIILHKVLVGHPTNTECWLCFCFIIGTPQTTSCWLNSVSLLSAELQYRNWTNLVLIITRWTTPNVLQRRLLATVEAKLLQANKPNCGWYRSQVGKWKTEFTAKTTV